LNERIKEKEIKRVISCDNNQESTSDKIKSKEAHSSTFLASRYPFSSPS